jgi:hypothetical protein
MILVYLILLPKILAVLQINGTGFTTNTIVGQGPGKFIAFQLLLNTSIILKTPLTSEYSGTAKFYGNSTFDWITIADSKISGEYEIESASSMSVGWYFSHYDESMFIGRTLYPYMQKNLVRGIGCDCDFNYQFEISINKLKWKSQLVIGDNYIHVPKTFGWLDRTKNICIEFTELDLSLCTLDQKDNKYRLQSYNGTKFLIGTEALNIGLVNNRFSGTRVYGAYPSIIIYTDETLLFFGILVLLFLLWTLVFQDFYSIIFGYLSTFIVTCIQVRLIFGPAKIVDRILRTTTININWYMYIVGITLFLTAGANVFLLKNNCREAHKITENTLLTFTFIALLIGTTNVCEESILCVLLALAWVPITVRAAVLTKNYYIIILLAVFYPLIAITVVQPFMADIPEISSYAWEAANIFLLLPSLFLLAAPPMIIT